MGTVHRRRRTSRLDIGPYKRHELLTGEIFYPLMPYYTGYGDGSSIDVEDFISEEMKQDWIANREELLTFWKSGEYTSSEIFRGSKPWLFVRGSPDTLPWAAEIFDVSSGGRGQRARPSAPLPA
jgi:hypothetical protein